MKLMTKEIESRFKQLGEQDDAGDAAIVVAKFFNPVGSWTWYAISYDLESRIFFGFVHGFEDEFGSFSLDELESVKGPLGLGIERDRGWKEKTIGEVKTLVESGKHV